MTDQKEPQSDGVERLDRAKVTESSAPAPEILPPGDSPELDVPPRSLEPAKIPEEDSVRRNSNDVTRAEAIARGVWFGGAMLWSYVVIGEYVVGAELPEFLGWSAFMGIFVGAFLHGANRLGPGLMVRVGAAGIAAVALLILLVASLLGSSSRSEYQLVSAFFLLFGLAALLGGGRRARRLRYSEQLLPRLTWPQIVYLVLLGGNTALMLVAFVAQL